MTQTQNETSSGSHYAKPVVLCDGLFMWEIVAAFSEPGAVCELEGLCRDVRNSLGQSSVGKGLMQRYWNMQYRRLVWEAESFDIAQRTLTHNLSPSESKLRWKEKYKEEYPLWKERTFQGKGCDNNSVNTAKALCKGNTLSKPLTEKERDGMREVSQHTLTRGDYRMDRHLAKHKGKHKKNGENRWKARAYEEMEPS